ncbi:MAG: hypothetical protein AAF694_04145 [Bacteroidota bacterium]
MEKEDRILEGFNAGYTIQQYEPELMQTLQKDLENSNDPYIRGFLAGAKEYRIEKEMDRSNLFPGLDEGISRDFQEKGIDKGAKDKGIDMDV